MGGGRTSMERLRGLESGEVGGGGRYACLCTGGCYQTGTWMLQVLVD